MSPEFCELIIDAFEKNSDQHESIDINGVKKFTVLKIAHHPQQWSSIMDRVRAILMQKIKDYTYDLNIDVNIQWPRKMVFEGLRIKKYQSGTQDEFTEHVDALSPGARGRFLAMIFYLNDNEAGFTVFKDHDLHIQPEAGKLLIFPPFWNYKHAGETPVNGPKYIISTFLLY